MIYADLKNAYGPTVADTIHQSLTPWEFEELSVADIVPYLETRAAQASRAYRTSQTTRVDEATILLARRRWQEAEDLIHTLAFLLEAEPELAQAA